MNCLRRHVFYMTGSQACMLLTHGGHAQQRLLYLVCVCSLGPRPSLKGRVWDRDYLCVSLPS